VQLYRNGIVETVDSTVTAVSSGSPIISGLDDNLIQETMRSFNDLATVGVEPPYALLVSLLAVTGARFYVGRDGRYDPAWYDRLSYSLERDQYHFDEVIFETVPTSRAECAVLMRPILDQMANTGGTAKSPIFDRQGQYIPLAR
jgi:hypothetical protein